MFDFSEQAGLIGLFVSSFVSATLLPGSSEVTLIAVLHKHPDSLQQAVATATLGNTLGGVASYVMGRLIPSRADNRALSYLRQYGYWALLFSWVPLVGDALCVAAGWLRFNPWWSILLFAVGKLCRYVVVAGGWTWFTATALTAVVT